jgi:hypothetical protein
MFLIWTGNSTTEWSAFCKDVDNFGVLTWDIGQQKLSTSVVFLDLTLTIDGNRITSKTHQKEINLYLYIPPWSAHSRINVKGTIFGDDWLTTQSSASAEDHKNYRVCIVYKVDPSLRAH